jgi:hypothetical protein
MSFNFSPDCDVKYGSVPLVSSRHAHDINRKIGDAVWRSSSSVREEINDPDMQSTIKHFFF